MEVKASVKYIRISAQKATQVLRLIRRKPVDQAFSILNNSTRKVAPIAAKLLNSAVYNATENHGLLVENLTIATAIANEGPTMKRYRARAKGRADQKLRRTAILEITVTDEYTRKGAN